MAAEQTVLFTVLPRGISINRPTHPLSILVSPRLVGESRLGAFPDWLTWTNRLRENGLVFTLRAGPRTIDVPIDRAILRPDLWQALFNDATLVRSRTFDDYSRHGIISYSVRESLSLIKSIYQEAGVLLALPEAERNEQTSERGGNRALLQALLDGLDVHWNGDLGQSWRRLVRAMHSPAAASALAGGTVQRSLQGPLDSEGLIIAQRNAGALQGVAIPFAVFHHLPTPRSETAGEVAIDPDAFDFHQAIGSLETHPELMRALGLILDIEVPVDFLEPTAAGSFSTVSVAATSVGWQIPTTTTPLETAYIHFAAGNNRYFMAASRTMSPGGAPAQVVGLLHLDPQRFGLAQVDVDGGMHKAIMLAETWNNPDSGRNLVPESRPQAAPHPEIFDPDATLPALRSGGLQVYADRRGLQVLDAITQATAFNTALEAGGAQPRPFFAEDLVRGYRLDIWDSQTMTWHSLHQRQGDYQIGDNRLSFTTDQEEGFLQTAAVQPAPGAEPADKDLYIHEAIARWMGWSLSVAMPGKALSRHGDPARAVPPDGDDPDYRTDEAITPYKIQAIYRVLPGSLPQLRFGRRYRVRARAVDLAGNSLAVDQPLADLLARLMALPRDPEGLVYLRYEPLAAPLIIIRDDRAVTGPGSAVDRLVIRTFNSEPARDTDPADLTAGDRHIVPPRTSVELGERHGIFDDASGKLKSDAATWSLIASRDAGEFGRVSIDIAGKTDIYPLEGEATIAALPYLPDPMARGAALRNLPGAAEGTVGRAVPDGGMAGALTYTPLDDPNPRPGSATLVSFNANTDWQQTHGFRLALSEPAPGQSSQTPDWDPVQRLLTVYLAKGSMAVVPLSSYLMPDDLKLMGIWQWLREYIERLTILGARPVALQPGLPVDRIAHILQRAVEGGHWMLTPPHLLTLVHAVQQPIGQPTWAALNVDHEEPGWAGLFLATAPLRGRTDPAELAPITAWRRAGATDAFLMGALKIHGASTARIDLQAEWSDPIDDPAAPGPDQRQVTMHVEELPLPLAREGYLRAPGAENRTVGYYDPEHDQIAMVRQGDRTGQAATYPISFTDAAPRHLFNDTKRHRVTYRAVGTSRYREYFVQEPEVDPTRVSDPIVVDVPASARPLAPEIVYVVPTFGWQRQAETNVKRSLRFGGGLRVYLQRPWYSSGAGELLGVALWSGANGPLNDQQRDKYKPFFTQWGHDPIWQSAGLGYVPSVHNLPDAVAADYAVMLEESNAAVSLNVPGRVDVVGFEPQFDASHRLWYADLTINLPTPTYAPFVRLALVRYQPMALAEARISRVVLAEYAQLTPDRAATVTADPHHPRTLRVTVSGVAPRGPLPEGPFEPRPTRPTHVRLRVQQRGSTGSELDWRDVTTPVASVTQIYEGPGVAQPDLALWIGLVQFAERPAADQYRLLIEEFEYISANYADNRQAPGRLIYAETFAIDGVLVGE